MAVGFDLTTGEPLRGGPLRVWLLNGQEEQDDIDRRVAAVRFHYHTSEADLAELARIQPHSCFSRLSQADLGATGLFFVVEKAP